LAAVCDAYCSARVVGWQKTVCDGVQEGGREVWIWWRADSAIDRDGAKERKLARTSGVGVGELGRGKCDVTKAISRVGEAVGDI
jgi:hypothetical protein